MKVLLINCPIRLHARPNCIPYGLATIAAVLRGAGFDVEIYDINALRPTKDQIANQLGRKTWDVVGISGLVTTYTFQRWLSGVLKDLNPEAPVVSGGGLATSSSDLLFAGSPIDVAVVGEGEQAMLALCRAVEKGRELGSVFGLRFRKDGRIVDTPKRANIKDLDTIPLPAWDLLPMEIYLSNPIWGSGAKNSSGFKPGLCVNRSMNVISSRGCPFSCRYCYHLFGPSSYRCRSAENVFEEVCALVQDYGVDFVGFVDDNMMAHVPRLLDFCRMMEEAGVPVNWGCHGRVTSAKPEVLEKMAAAGCVWIGYGIESGSQKILDAMNKKATVAQARRAILQTRQAGIYANTTFIFGYPGETRKTIQETVEFKRELGIKCGSFFATPYPGTVLYEQVRGRIKDEAAFIRSLGDATEFCINLTEFSDQELLRLKAAMDANEDVLCRNSKTCLAA